MVESVENVWYTWMVCENFYLLLLYIHIDRHIGSTFFVIESFESCQKVCLKNRTNFSKVSEVNFGCIFTSLIAVIDGHGHPFKRMIFYFFYVYRLTWRIELFRAIIREVESMYNWHNRDLLCFQTFLDWATRTFV